ncbi:N-acetylmuramoyl-L-alanine amidase [Bartonella sp. HY328]|uniref:N-acetylmuramoyl-L-alanine amidase n=1 Tax=Bartonella sp. HY328 TaxID=2979320 RepID=UPI0021C70652|nr:N-acetylmuramoyl-L-alanine amidase [Bartonella sp. HY328]UXN08516.1 N-acetylmuramoyl-L-alanine amidase [Bartonella sp. HY328]
MARDNSAEFKVLNTRLSGDNSRLRIISVFNEKPNYSLMLLDNQPRLVIDLPKAEFLMPTKAVTMSGMAKELRYGAINAAQARMIFTMKHAFAIERVDVEPLNDNIWQLVIDIKTVPEKEFDKAVEQTRKFEQLRRTDPDNIVDDKKNAHAGNVKNNEFTIVIDAGHGGFDTGAIGVSGVEEKNVTLAFAKALKAALDEKNFKVVLTRDDDTFLRLGERVQLARSHSANLFISIHADSIHLPEIRGATVYTLSDKASDSLAKAVADNENKSDLLGDLPPDEPPEVADILIDLTRRETDGFSSQFAEGVISSLNEGKIRVINNPHRYAGFMVLKAPDIPSVLIELGYLSNPDDEKLITDLAWRHNMVHMISNAIEKYAQMRMEKAVP